MICHVCQRDAVGQCKSCGKFYCPEHGDVYCVTCRGGAPGKAKEPLFPDFAEPAQESGGPDCYLCHGTAVGACSFCGRFYCSVHSGNESDFWSGSRFWLGRRALCTTCHTVMATQSKRACLFALLVLFLLPPTILLIVWLAWVTATWF